jgi:DNA processing protein
LTNDLRYWLGFNLVAGIGPRRLQALLDAFGDLSAAWKASPAQLRDAGLDRRSLDSLLRARSTLSLDRELDKVRQAGVRLLCWEDESYPRHLRNIYDPPPLLYVRGTLRKEDEWAVAVVGTRRATVYGKEATRQLTSGLARNGITIVSGLARGIDAQAHRAALDAGGRTIAVLGCGVDVVYPPEHRRLALEVLERGALVSEYALGTQPEASNFPPRNRIISGLSLGVVVVEAGARSGALITADFAAEQGRDVFAVPGSIFQRGSEGCNRLIREGAIPALGATDILEELNLTMVEQQAEVRAAVPASDTEARLLDQLSSEPTHVDELCRSVDMPISRISSALALMELKGMVRQVGGMNYVVAREATVEYMVD